MASVALINANAKITSVGSIRSILFDGLRGNGLVFAAALANIAKKFRRTISRCRAGLIVIGYLDGAASKRE
jgi:hypothetical protein